MNKRPKSKKAKATKAATKAATTTGFEGVLDCTLGFLITQTKGSYQEAEQVMMQAGSTLNGLMAELNRRNKDAKNNKSGGGSPARSG